MEKAFGCKNTLKHFYSLAPRQNFPPGSYHHSQAAREITHPPSRQHFFLKIYPHSRKGGENRDK